MLFRSNRMVFETAGRSRDLSNGSRIYSGMRRGEGCSMDTTIFGRTQSGKQLSDIDHGQRRIIQPSENSEVPPSQPTHRTPLPLLTAASQVEKSHNANNPGEGQSGRHPHEAFAYELDQDMEEYVAGIDWDNWVMETLE